MSLISKKTAALSKLLIVASLLLAACSSSSSESSMQSENPCPTFVVTGGEAIPLEQAEMLIGMSETQAEICSQELGWTFVVGDRDGQMFPLTRDYRIDRVVVSVENEVVTAISLG